jgi:hypothetical protein
VQRVNLYDELVDEGVELDIAVIFVKIGGFPPSVLRPLRKVLLGYCPTLGWLHLVKACHIGQLRMSY